MKRHIGARENIIKYLEDFENFNVFAADEAGRIYRNSFARNFDYDRTGLKSGRITAASRKDLIDKLKEIRYTRADAERQAAIARRRYWEEYPDRYKKVFGDKAPPAVREEPSEGLDIYADGQQQVAKGSEV
ncbi:MAG: hypothetical protein K9M51_04080, partial [Candidatus Gracilibacteria bacterium]|nr:hypothetical protein [Candidatus Gracilibacteria bacterium]